MQAKNTAPSERRRVTRNKKAKIDAIIDATRSLIETMGYNKVTIRDIAASAGVSLGLVYKYFPNGKFDIITAISSRYVSEQFITPPETIDFNDFPGYMRAVIRNMQQFAKENSALVKAVTVAVLLDGEIVEEVKKVEIKDYTFISELFGRFDGVDISDKNPLELLADWVSVVKGIIIFSTIYPVSLRSEEALIDLMTDLSLKIWGYKKRP
jgi:AcrR family transcriptional regulator